MAWDCSTDRMNAAVLDAWLADLAVRRQERMKARAEGQTPPPAPRLLYSACPTCEQVLRVAGPDSARCPRCEDSPCPILS